MRVTFTRCLCAVECHRESIDPEIYVLSGVKLWARTRGAGAQGDERALYLSNDTGL